MKLIHMHYRGFTDAITRIVTKPFEHGLNIIVISLLITLLTATFIINKNITNWENMSISYPQILIELNIQVKATDIAQLEVTLAKIQPNIIKSYKFISKQEGLQDLQQNANLKNIASDVISNSDNPLNDILIINTNTANLTILNKLITTIQNQSMVSNVTLDSNYANKLGNLINLMQKTGIFLQIILIIIFILVIANMVRLEMLLCHDEINVSRLIGASNTFIMRPLAYYACLQVLLSTFIAYFMSYGLIEYMGNFFQQLPYIFGNNFYIANLTLIEWLIAGGILIIFTIFAVFLAIRVVFLQYKSQ